MTVPPKTPPTKSLDAYYCNSSFNPLSSIKVTASPNCIYMDSFLPAQLDIKSFSDNKSSYSKSTYGIINGKIGNIVATPYIYLYYETKSILF